MCGAPSKTGEGRGLGLGCWPDEAVHVSKGARGEKERCPVIKGGRRWGSWALARLHVSGVRVCSVIM